MLFAALAVAFAALSAVPAAVQATAGRGPASAKVLAHQATPAPGAVEVVAGGLTNPRGFAWGPDGSLYLALAGVGGEREGTLAGGPSGIFGGPTAGIVRIEGGCPVPVAEGLPSGHWRASGWIWGAMDVAFLGDELYALLGGGGADFGNPATPNGVYRVEDDGPTTLVANLSEWLADVPPNFVAPDYNSDGSLFDMEAGEDDLWVSEAVGGRLLKVAPDGAITLVADLSAGHLVPTGIALAPDGGAYVGFETTVPYPDGASKVVHVAADGTVTDAWTGLTAVTDVVLGPDGALYAAEMATGNADEEPYLTPNSGRVVRQTGPDSLEAVVTDIPYPVALGFDAAGALHVGYPAFGPDAGAGQGAILRIDLGGGPVSLAGLGTPATTCAAATASPADRPTR
jgi:sugar lactone lactonase YvrE